MTCEAFAHSGYPKNHHGVSDDDNMRFDIGCTPYEKRDLDAFLKAPRASLDRKDCRMDCSNHQRTRRMLATVTVTTLAAATVFAALNHKPSKADESVLVYTPSFDVEPPMTYVDPSLPLASDAFTKTPGKDDERCPTF